MTHSLGRPKQTKNLLTHIIHHSAQNIECGNILYETRARHFNFNECFFVATELQAFSIRNHLKANFSALSSVYNILRSVDINIGIKQKLIIIFSFVEFLIDCRHCAHIGQQVIS